MAGGGDTTTTSKRYMPPWQEKLFKQAIEEAGVRYKDPIQFYPQSTVGEQDRMTVLANQQTEALGNQEYMGASKDFLTGQLRGDFMQNPMLDEMSKVISQRVSDNYMRTTAPQTLTRFAGAGRSSSDATNLAMDQNERNLGRALYEGEASLRYGDYNDRMRDRLTSLGLAPTVFGMDTGTIGQLRAGGASQEAYYQRLLDDLVARYNFGQQEPESRLDRFLGRVSNEGLGGTITTAPAGGDGGAGLGLGIAGALATVAGAFTGGSTLPLAGMLLSGVGGGVSAASKSPYGQGLFSPNAFDGWANKQLGYGG